MNPDVDVVEALAALIRGDLPAARGLMAVEPDRVLGIARQEGVVALAAEQAAGLGPFPAGEALFAEAQRLAAEDIVREAELVALLGALAAGGVDVALFKGAHLAYTCYARPDLRPRLDSDLMVRPADREAAHEVLVASGYDRVAQFEGDLISYQRTYTKPRAGAVAHVVDLHWRISNPQRFGAMVSCEEMLRGAQRVPRLGSGGRVVSATHAMFLACVHPAAHHPGTARLIWTHDVKALADVMSCAEWNDFSECAVSRGAGSICLRALDRARVLLNAVVPDDVMARFAACGRAGTSEFWPARKLISALDDVRLLDNWSARARWTRQHLFPGAGYMRAVYAPGSRAPLAWLYARRATRGAMKWLRRS